MILSPLLWLTGSLWNKNIQSINQSVELFDTGLFDYIFIRFPYPGASQSYSHGVALFNSGANSKGSDVYIPVTKLEQVRFKKTRKKRATLTDGWDSNHVLPF